MPGPADFRASPSCLHCPIETYWPVNRTKASRRRHRGEGIAEEQQADARGQDYGSTDASDVPGVASAVQVEDDRPGYDDLYVGRRRAGARPGGCLGALRAGGFGIGRATGSSGTRVMAAPWWATSSGSPWSRA